MNFKKITSITVYCSSSNKISISYKKQAKKIGFFLAQKNIKLVYGGGSNGLMGEVARSVKEKNGYVTGIIPKFLIEKEGIDDHIDEKIIVNDMSQRKKLLFNKGEAFIALPGGAGTIEEITEIISWFNLGLHSKPIIFFNYKNFWDPLISIYKNIYKDMLIEKKHKELFYTIRNINEIKKLFK
tara:strand:+ start:89 stop:637 length:549 start_codon:yes stop_codon:yes gene_type:complete